MLPTFQTVQGMPVEKAHKLNMKQFVLFRPVPEIAVIRSGPKAKGLAA
jgi:hypothetical protein